MTRAGVAVLGLVTVLWPLSAATAAGTPGSSFAAETGSHVLAAALSAAHSMGSCTSTSSARISGQAYSSVVLSTTTTGQQTITASGAHSVVRVVGGVVYLDDNATALKDQFGVSAPKYANTWIAIPSSNSNYSRFAEGILLSSVLSEVSPSGTLKVSKVTTVDGRAVVGVSGHPNSHMGLVSTGTQTLYVAATGAHVPVEIVASDVEQGARQTFVITFRGWGESLGLTAPTNSTPISRTKLPS